MVLRNGMRPIQRDHNGLMIFLRMEDWPEDVPLPDGTTQMVTGAGPFPPYWRIFLEPDKTVEMIVGWFIVPHLSVEDTLSWYQAEMEKLGWVEVKRTDTLPSWAMLRYGCSETDLDTETYVVISIWRNRYLNRTQPMIRRVTVHPWSPGEEETSEVEVEQEMAGDESMAEHGLGGEAERRLDKVAIPGSH